MRSIYATAFDLGDARLEDALPVVVEWFTREDSVGGIAGDVSPGLRNYLLPDGRGSLDVEVLENHLRRMWTGSWRHPHSDDPSLDIVSTATLAEIEGVVSFGLRVEVERTREELTPIRYQFFAPRLPRDLVDRFTVWDGETRLRSTSTLVGQADVDRFIERVLCDRSRQRPVVFISSDERGSRPDLAPEDVARDLCGLAHVFHTVYALPERTLSRKLGSLGCYGGAVRVYWPGFDLESDRYKHPLYTPARLRSWHGKPFRETLRDQLFSIGASTMAAPRAFREFRRAVRRRELQARDVPEEWLEELEQVEEERDQWLQEATKLEGELERATEEIDRLKTSFAQVSQTAAVTVEPTDGPARDEEAPKTVLEAVERAEGLCPHLVFLEAAFESAADSPFEDPPAILEALLRLEELADREARPGGIGRGLSEAALGLGLQWRGGISQTAATRHREEYTRRWNGHAILLGPHVCLGSGSGAGKIARIYLYRHEAEDPDDRRYVVGHVGRKLPDTTT